MSGTVVDARYRVAIAASNVIVLMCLGDGRRLISSCTLVDNPRPSLLVRTPLFLLYSHPLARLQPRCEVSTPLSACYIVTFTGITRCQVPAPIKHSIAVISSLDTGLHLALVAMIAFTHSSNSFRCKTSISPNVSKPKDSNHR